MNCRRFELELAEWARGRAPGHVAADMQAHAASCSACAALAAAESDLRGRVQALQPVSAPVDLWPRVQDRIAGRPARRMLWTPARLWALGGAAAAAALGLLVLRGPDPGPSVALADDQRVLNLVSEMRAMPDPELDPFIAEVRDHRAAEQAVVVGYAGW